MLACAATLIGCVAGFDRTTISSELDVSLREQEGHPGCVFLAIGVEETRMIRGGGKPLMRVCNEVVSLFVKQAGIQWDRQFAMRLSQWSKIIEKASRHLAHAAADEHQVSLNIKYEIALMKARKLVITADSGTYTISRDRHENLTSQYQAVLTLLEDAFSE